MTPKLLRNGVKFTIVVVFRPAMRALAVILSPVYRALIGPIDSRIHRRLRKRLEADVRAELPWLFEKHHGRIVADESNRQSFDYATVIVAADHMVLRFIRGRAELRLDIAPAHAPSDWFELQQAFALLDDAKQQRASTYYRLYDLGRLLEQNWDRLDTAFSETQYGPPDRGRSTISLGRL
jgi:hypothetical protein